MPNKDPRWKGAKLDLPSVEVMGSKLPSYVKCFKCGKGPTEADWLKPVSPGPDCRKFIHISEIPNGPGVSAEAGFILRNS